MTCLTFPGSGLQTSPLRMHIYDRETVSDGSVFQRCFLAGPPQASISPQ